MLVPILHMYCIRCIWFPPLMQSFQGVFQVIGIFISTLMVKVAIKYIRVLSVEWPRRIWLIRMLRNRRFQISFTAKTSAPEERNSLKDNEGAPFAAYEFSYGKKYDLVGLEEA